MWDELRTFATEHVIPRMAVGKQDSVRVKWHSEYLGFESYLMNCAQKLKTWSLSDYDRVMALRRELDAPR